MIKWQGPENVACFIVEPIVGATMGAVTPPPGYFQRIRQICDRYDVLFIMDEVMTGFGRTGRWFASEHWDVVPDIVTAAKGVSGGYAPLAVLMATDEVVGALEAAGTPFVAGHTFAQNPVVAAAGIAVVSYIQKHELVAAAEERGLQLLTGLREIVAKHPIAGEARGMGLMLGIELVSDKRDQAAVPSRGRCGAPPRQGVHRRGRSGLSGPGWRGRPRRRPRHGDATDDDHRCPGRRAGGGDRPWAEPGGARPRRSGRRPDHDVAPPVP